MNKLFVCLLALASITLHGCGVYDDADASSRKCVDSITLKRFPCPKPKPNPNPQPVPAPTPAPSFSVQDVTVSESAGTATIHIVKTAANGSSSSLTYTTANISATAGSDYTATSGSITFADGDTDKTVTVPIADDTAQESSETFALNLTAVTNATVAKNGTITIIDNDLAPISIPSLSVTNVSVNEDAGSVMFNIHRSGDVTRSTSFEWTTVDGTAKAGTNYTASSAGRTFAVGATDMTANVPILDDGAVTPNLSFGINLSILTNGTVSKNGTVTVVNTDLPPEPTPTGYVDSPSLHGLPDIDSNFNINDYMVPGPTPGSAAADLEGAFRFLCAAGQVLADDPILFPGQPGKSHLHQFYGNLDANAYSTYSSLRSSGDSTCVGPLNRSGYWMPALEDGHGNVVRPDYVAIYYKRRPASDPVVSDPNAKFYMGQAVPLPNGLRFIFGWDPTGINSARTGAAWFNCDGPTAVPGRYNSIPEAAAHCPGGNRIGAVIFAPDCWDGQHLDSPDHRSHMAYATYGSWGYLKCDAAHPYVIPQFTLGAWYSIAPGEDASTWRFSSDAMAPGQAPGYTFHADWFGAWDQPTLQAWTDNCINKLLSCNSGNLGNGTMMKQALPWTGLANPRLIPISEIPQTPSQ